MGSILRRDGSRAQGKGALFYRCAMHGLNIVLNALPKRLPTLLRTAGSAFAIALATAGASQAGVVERVVAVVGERPILLSDLRQRAVPLLAQIQAAAQSESQRAAATSSMYGTLLNRMVDEELEKRAAAAQNVRITQKEIDAAIGRVAAQQGLTPEELLLEAKRTGLTDASYQDEIRRQLLEAKLINMRLAGRIHISEDDLRSHYQRYVFEERAKLPFRAAWIHIDAPRNAEDTEKRLAMRKARAIAKRAAEGADFSKLAKKYSADPTVDSHGGMLPELTPDKLPPGISRVMLGLEVGNVSSPVRQGDHLIVIKLIDREESELPTYEEARAELQQRVYMEKMSKAREHWLDSLRRRTHVDIRL